MEVKLNDLGLMEIPRKLCHVLKLGEGSPVEISHDYKNIVIKVHSPACPLCGNTIEAESPEPCERCRKEIIYKYNEETKQRED